MPWRKSPAPCAARPSAAWPAARPAISTVPPARWRVPHHSRIHLFLSTSPLHREHKLGMSKQQVIDTACASIERAKALCHEVEFSAEDALRTEPEFLVEVFSAAAAAGASTLNAPDTVGYTTPAEIAELFAYLRKHVRGAEQVIFSTHCHDDLGMAVANSLAGVSAGARQVECTINGIGERAGNASLEEVVMALRVRRPHFGLDTGIDTRKLYPTSRLLTQLTGQGDAAQQGDRRRERVRARVGHPPARHAQASRHLRNHASGGRRHGRDAPGARQAFRSPRACASAWQSLGHDARRRARSTIIFTRFKALADKKREVHDERPGGDRAGPRSGGHRPVAHHPAQYATRIWAAALRPRYG